jgi:hypothetical protein
VPELFYKRAKSAKKLLPPEGGTINIIALISRTNGYPSYSTLGRGARNDSDGTSITVQWHKDTKYAGCCTCAQRMAVDLMFLLQYRSASEVDGVWLAEQVEGPNQYRRLTDVSER